MASHGNDLPDILQTFLATDRDILFVANIAAADLPFVRWTYAGLGVIPVSRVRDARALKARGEDASALNANAFVRVVEALKQGHCVAIFPEGVVPDFPRLGTLRSGAAKMALQAIDAGVSSLTMVPIGFQYECAHETRSGALCVVGGPVAVERWTPVQSTKRVSEFTDFICDELQQLTRNSRTQHDAAVLATVSAVVAGALSSDTGRWHVPQSDTTQSRSSSARTLTPIATAHPVQRLLSKLSAADGIFVADASAPSAIEQHGKLLNLQHSALALSRLTASFGARSWSARDQADVFCAAGPSQPSLRPESALVIALLAPIAAVGWVWHAVPWAASYAIATKFAPRKVEFAAITLVPGLYVVVLWYLLAPSVLLAFGISPWIVLVVFLTQPRLGDFAVNWRERWRSLRLRGLVLRASDGEKDALVSQARAFRTEWEVLDKVAASIPNTAARATGA